MIPTVLIVALGLVVMVMALSISRLQKDVEGLTGILLYTVLYLKDEDEDFGNTDLTEILEDYLDNGEE